MKEHNIQNQLMINISKIPNLTIFRTNVGMAWTGDATRNRDGSITLHNPRPFKTGLPRGFPDCIVLKSKEIKPEDVGKKICEFMFLEVKTEEGKLSEEQKHIIDFLQNTKNAQGIVSYGVEEGTSFFENNKE